MILAALELFKEEDIRSINSSTSGNKIRVFPPSVKNVKWSRETSFPIGFWRFALENTPISPDKRVSERDEEDHSWTLVD